MGKLTFAINVTLDGCCDHRAFAPDAELMRYYTRRLAGGLAGAVKALKRRTPRGLLVGSPSLAAQLQRLGLLDEYRFAVHPVLAGRGPFLFQGLLRPERLKFVDAARFKSGVTVLRYRRK